MFESLWQNDDWCSVQVWLRQAQEKDRHVRAVLAVTSSLTTFLAQRFGMVLDVQLHEQFMDRMSAQEMELLACQADEYALRRRVSLCYQGAVMFDAESVLPLRGLPADLVESLEEGKRPLANLLQERGLSLSRSDLSVIHLQDGRWGRRSVLRSALGTQALVVELFRPEFWDVLKGLRAQI